MSALMTGADAFAASNSARVNPGLALVASCCAAKCGAPPLHRRWYPRQFCDGLGQLCNALPDALRRSPDLLITARWPLKCRQHQRQWPLTRYRQPLHPAQRHWRLRDRANARTCATDRPGSLPRPPHGWTAAPATLPQAKQPMLPAALLLAFAPAARHTASRHRRQNP
jgi:hypothetical protein